MNSNFVIKKDQIGNIVFFISLGLYLIITILDSSFYCSWYSQSLVSICMFLSIIFIILKEIMVKKIRFKEFVYLIVCLIVSLLVVYHLNMITMLPLFFLIYGGRDIKLDKILKFIQIVTAILLLFIILSSKLNIIMNYVSYSVHRKREYLGFRYCLFPAMYMFNISAISLYLNRRKVPILKILILTLLNYIIFKYTDSRLSFYLYIFLLIGYLLLSNSMVYKLILKIKLIRKLSVLSYVIMTILSFIAITVYNPYDKKMAELNYILENRIYLGKLAIKEYNITLFGNNVKFVGNGLGRNGLKSTEKYNYVDCLYITIVIKYGISFILIYLLLHTIALNNLNKNNNLLLMFILITIALHGLIDDLGLDLYFNSFWFAIGTNIINKKSKLEKI